MVTRAMLIFSNYADKLKRDDSVRWSKQKKKSGKSEKKQVENKMFEFLIKKFFKH